MGTSTLIQTKDMDPPWKVALDILYLPTKDFPSKDLRTSSVPVAQFNFGLIKNDLNFFKPESTHSN